MFFSKLFLLCLLYYGCSAAKEDVLEFDDRDFDSSLAQHENALVLFYAPWCTHCQKLKPEFADAASELMRNKPPVSLIQVDCTKGGKETCDKYDITGYPTLKVFLNGEFAQNYDGVRDSENIVKYMKGLVESKYHDINTVNDLNMFLKDENKVAVVGFFEKDSDLKRAFLEASGKSSHKAKFGQCVDKTLLKKQGIFNGIILFRPNYLRNMFENDSVVYSGPAAAGNIKSFIYENCHGLVGHRKIENKNDFKNPLVVVYYNIDYSKDPKGTKYWRNRVLKVAKQYKNEINFAISHRDDFQHELIEFDISFEKEDKPTVLARDSNNLRYKMNETFSTENLNQFVANLIKKKLKPYVKSQPIPKTNNEPVKIAVADNFDEVVIKNKRDTLIAFYAPWCGHCKRLAPLYEELGNRLKNEDIDVVKMDATANDIPPKFTVEGYPTVYWVPKKSKSNPVVYQGSLEVDELIKFIAKNADKEMKGYDRQGKLKDEKTLEKTEL